MTHIQTFTSSLHKEGSLTSSSSLESNDFTEIDYQTEDNSPGLLSFLKVAYDGEQTAMNLVKRIEPKKDILPISDHHDDVNTHQSHTTVYSENPLIEAGRRLTHQTYDYQQDIEISIIVEMPAHRQNEQECASPLQRIADLHLKLKRTSEDLEQSEAKRVKIEAKYKKMKEDKKIEGFLNI